MLACFKISLTVSTVCSIVAMMLILIVVLSTTSTNDDFKPMDSIGITNSGRNNGKRKRRSLIDSSSLSMKKKLYSDNDDDTSSSSSMADDEDENENEITPVDVSFKEKYYILSGSYGIENDTLKIGESDSEGYSFS